MRAGFSNVSAVNIAMRNFESNLMAVRGSGNASSAMELEPLPSQYFDIWRGIDFIWQKYKEYIIDNIIKSSQTGSKQISANLITELQSMALSLISSSDRLVTALAKEVKTDSQNLTLSQILLGSLNISYSHVNHISYITHAQANFFPNKGNC